jgi:hypothetical protein
MKQPKVEPSPNGGFAAAATPTEKKVVKCFAVLMKAELSLRRPGKEFGKAVIELRDEVKKNRSGEWMKRLKELGIPYAKARYWMAIAEGKPIHRGKAKQGASVEAQEKPKVDWREDWGATTARFREAAGSVIMLVERQPERREAFIGELEILADSLGYELKAKKKGTTNGVLQRVRPEAGGVAA